MTWSCDGVPKDGKTYSNQNPPGSHQRHNNNGTTCVMCGLPQEAMGRGGGKAPVAVIAAVLTSGIVALVAGGYLLWPKSCPSGQQKISDICVVPNQTAATTTPTPTLTLTPTSTPTPTYTSTGAFIAAPVTLYRTLGEVPNVPQMKVRYGGSTSFAPLRSAEIVARITQAHPGFDLIYTQPSSGTPGSGKGISMLLDGNLSVAQSSRSVKDEEYAQAKTRNFTLEQIPVAIDGIAFYVNPQLSIPGLNISQIKDIYTGKITNWSEVGGPSVPIVPLSRNPKDGGTPEYFVEQVLAKEAFAPSVEPYMVNTTAAIRKVGTTLGAISYATATEVCNQTTIRSLAISKESSQKFMSACNGVQVNKADLSQNNYPLTRRLFVVVKRDGRLDEQAGVAYANLLLSDEGQQLINQAGLVPIR